MELTRTIQNWLDSNGGYQLGIAYLMASNSNTTLATRLGKKETAQNRTELKAALRKHLIAAKKTDEKLAVTDFLKNATTTVEAYNPANAGTGKKNSLQHIRGIRTGRGNSHQTAASRRKAARKSSGSGGCNGCGR